MALTSIKETAGGGIEKSEIPALQKQLETILKNHPEKMTEALMLLKKALEETPEDTKGELTKLITDYESKEVAGNGEYSLEGLKSSIDDEKGKKLLEMYQLVIANDLKSLYGESFTNISSVGQESIKLIFWDLIVSQIGIKGGINIAKGKIGSFTNMISGVFGGGDEETEESILTQHLKKDTGAISLIKKSSDSALGEDIDGVIEIVDSLIGRQANNLKTLFNLTDALGGDEKKQVFENPVILKSVLNTGAYKGEGFDISLSEKRVTIGTVDDIKSTQASFMQGLKQDSKGLSGTMKSLQDKANKIEKTLEKFGIKGGLDGIKETLFSIPIFGVFLKVIFGDFFKQFGNAGNLAAIDSVLSAMKHPEQKKSLKQFETFSDKLAQDDSGKKTPLGKLLGQGKLTKDFYKNTDPFFRTLDTAKVSYDKRDFWKQILTGKGAGGAEKIIFAKLKGTLDDDPLTEKALTQALNSIQQNDLPIQEKKEADQNGTADSTNTDTPNDNTPDTSKKPDNTTDTTTTPQIPSTTASLVGGGAAATSVKNMDTSGGDKQVDTSIPRGNNYPEQNTQVANANTPPKNSGGHPVEAATVSLNAVGAEQGENETVEVAQPPSIEEQIAGANELPTDLVFPNGDKISLNIDSAKKQILLGDVPYNLGIYLDFDTEGSLNLLEEINFSQGITKVTAKGETQTIGNSQIASMIKTLITDQNIQVPIEGQPAHIKISKA